jgi:hypothetical protein
VVFTPDVAANRVSEPAEIGWSLVSRACGVLAPFLEMNYHHEMNYHPAFTTVWSASLVREKRRRRKKRNIPD